MFDAPAGRLAVASLTEAGDGAVGRRRSDGRPLQGYVLMTGQGAGCRITVYLEQGDGAPAAVLSGAMVWLQTQPETVQERAREPQAADEHPPAGDTTGEADTEEVLEEEPAEIGFKLYPEPATPVVAAPSAPPAPPPDDDAVPSEPPSTADGAVALHARHPTLPRAWGIARMDFDQGNLTLAVRGLPAPSTLGPAYTAYQAWLVGQRAGTREPLGLLTRVWGDNFRLEAGPGLPLSRFDAIAVTAAERQGGATQNPPQVLFGSYQ